MVILENFRLCLIQRTLEELPDFEVMTWQLCHLLRSALNCVQKTRLQKYLNCLNTQNTNAIND